MLMPNYRGAQGTRGPDRALLLNFELRWSGKPALLRWAELKLAFTHDQQVVSAALSIPRLPRLVEERMHGEWVEQVRVPMSAEAIRFIEEKRSAGDVNLLGTFAFAHFNLPDGNTRVDLPAEAFAGTGSQTNTCGISVPHSEWLKVLHSMGWDEVELFELSKLPLEQDENLAEALSRIRDARDDLRRGDYRGVLANCRAAFESAAKHQQPDNVASGFELLFGRAFKNEPLKAKLMNEIAGSLSKYMHTVGRHEQAPPIHPTRSEAEYLFTTTLSLFSMLSRRLTGQEM